MSIVESFDIDDGSVERLSPNLSFVLGVEWGLFYFELLMETDFERVVHSENLKRLKLLCERHEKRLTETLLNDDFVKLRVFNE